MCEFYTELMKDICKRFDGKEVEKFMTTKANVYDYINGFMYRNKERFTGRDYAQINNFEIDSVCDLIVRKLVFNGFVLEAQAILVASKLRKGQAVDISKSVVKRERKRKK